MEILLKEIQAKLDDYYTLDDLNYDWEQLSEYIVEEHDYFEGTASYYLEPGYSDPDKGILLADWNYVPQLHQDILEHVGYDLEWSDEWMITDTGGAVRSTPDSYEWQPSYILTPDGDLLTSEDDPEEVIAAAVCDDPAQSPKAFPHWLNPADHGFFPLHEGKDIPFRSGFHEGMTDNPEDQLREAFAEWAECEVAFVTAPSQFYTEWEAWVRIPAELGSCPDYPHLSVRESKNHLIDTGQSSLRGLVHGWRWDGGAYVAQLWNPETDRLEQLVWDEEELTTNEVAV